MQHWMVWQDPAFLREEHRQQIHTKPIEQSVERLWAKIQKDEDVLLQ